MHKNIPFSCDCVPQGCLGYLQGNMAMSDWMWIQHQIIYFIPCYKSDI